MGISSQCEDRGMFQQKQHVADFLLFAQGDKLALQVQRFRIADATEVEQMEKHQSSSRN